MANRSKEDLQKLSELNFRYCTPPCDEKMISQKLAERLILAQRMCGEQFTITCAFRSQKWERDHGRKGTSSHCKMKNGEPCSLAVDVSAVNSHLRFKILAGLILAGFPRLGIGKTFIHADIDETKPHPIVFHYYDPQET